MKKLLIFSTMALLAFKSQGQSSWSFGMSLSSYSNYSQFSGGMTNASASFHHDDSYGGGFNFIARKKFNEHWSGQTGLGFYSIGFTYTLTQDYSLLDPCGQYVVATNSEQLTSIPVSILYNTHLNCRNWRWFIGGGLSLAMAQGKNLTTTNADEEGNTASLIFEHQYTSSGFATFNGQLLGGIEKVYKRGALLSLGLIYNAGFNTLATSEIKYTINGTDYNHIYTNNGSYFGGYIAYCFRPFGSKKALTK